MLRKRSGKRMDRVVRVRCCDGASDLRANLPVLVDSGSLRSFLNFTFKMDLWVLGFSCPSILLTPLLFSNPQSYIYSTKVLKLVFPGSETMLNLPWSIWKFLLLSSFSCDTTFYYYHCLFLKYILVLYIYYSTP